MGVLGVTPHQVDRAVSGGLDQTFPPVQSSAIALLLGIPPAEGPGHDPSTTPTSPSTSTSTAEPDEAKSSGQNAKPSTPPDTARRTQGRPGTCRVGRVTDGERARVTERAPPSPHSQQTKKPKQEKKWSPTPRQTNPATPATTNGPARAPGHARSHSPRSNGAERSVTGQPPQGRDLRAAGAVEGISGVPGSWMSWPGVNLVHHGQTRCLDGRQEFAARPESETLGQVGQDQPSFTSRLKVRGQSVQESAEHAAVRVVDALFHRGGGPGWNPGRVADDEVRAPVGEEAGSHNVDTPGEAQSGGGSRGRRPGRAG